MSRPRDDLLGWVPGLRARHALSLVPSDPALRRLAGITVIDTFGNGLLMTLSTLYFSHIVGIPLVRVGLGLTLAGLVGVAAPYPLGRLADRIGARRTAAGISVMQAVAVSGYLLVHSFAAFLAAAGLVAALDRGSAAVRPALYAAALPSDALWHGRAYLRSVTNLGVGSGSAIAAIAIQLDTRHAYGVMMVIDSVTCLSAALLLRRVPMRSPSFLETGAARSQGFVLRDFRYLAVTALSGVLFLQFGLLLVGLPEWIVGGTRAPRLVVAAGLVLNTFLCVVLQVRSSRGVDGVRTAGLTARRGGMMLAGACLLYALAGHGPPAWASLILLAGVGLHSAAEIRTSAAGWVLSYELADPSAPGAYQGVYATGSATATAVAPALVTWTALRFGFPGWCALAGCFVGAGTVLSVLTRE